MKTTRIKAFTLSEMVVAMVITVIVVGLAFTVLRLVQKQMGALERNYEQGTEAHLLRQALWTDFARYSQLSYNEGGNTLHCSNPLGGVTYLFNTDWVLRDKDTFRIALSKKTFYFKGAKTTWGPVDALELVTAKEQGSKQLFIYKHNAAAAYMQ